MVTVTLSCDFCQGRVLSGLTAAASLRAQGALLRFVQACDAHCDFHGLLVVESRVYS